MAELKGVHAGTPEEQKSCLPPPTEGTDAEAPKKGFIVDRVSRLSKTRKIIIGAVIVAIIVIIIIILSCTLPNSKEQTQELNKEQNAARLNTTTIVMPRPTTTATTTVMPRPTTATATVRPRPTTTTTTTTSFWDTMERMMDRAAYGERCEDFHKYACGGVMSNPDVDPKQPGVIARNMIKDQLDKQNSNDLTTAGGKMKAFYDSCLNQGSQDAGQNWAQPVKDMFGAYKFTELALDPFSEFTFDLSEALGYMMRRGFSPFFSIDLDVDLTNTDAFMLTLHPTVPGSPFSKGLAREVCLGEHQKNLQSLNLNPNASYNVTKEYNTFMECVGTGKGLEERVNKMKDAVAQFGLMSHLTAEKSKQLLEQTLISTETFLTELSEKLPYVPDLVRKLANMDYDYSDRSVSELDDYTIDWATLLGTFLDVDKSVSGAYKITTYMDNSMADIKDVLKDYHDVSPAELYNILVVLWAERVYTDFVEPVGASVGDPEYCLNAAIALMEDTASSLYLQAVAPDIDARNKQIDDIAQDIKWEGLGELGNISTDEAATKVLQDKLIDMMDHVIKLDKVDSDVATRSMEGVSLSGAFLHDSLLLLEHRSALFKNELDHGTGGTWKVFVRPCDPHGFYSYPLNRIMFPYAALEPFRTLKDIPGYLHYASIGYHLSHLMWHGYDTSGVAYPPQIQKSMEPLQKELKKLYLGARSHTNPSGLTAEYQATDLTRNEIWADAKATDLTWRAYENRNRTSQHADRKKESTRLGLNEEQLFYVYWAQGLCSHSSDLNMLEVMESRQPPGRDRVNFVTQHSEHFRDVYQCN